MKYRISASLALSALLVLFSISPALAETNGNNVVFIMTINPFVGIARGQVLRVSISDSSDHGADDSDDPLFVRLCDERGRTIAESEQVVIPRGGFHSFDFPYEVLPPERQEANGRQQVMIKIYLCPSDSESPALDASATVELFETRSGSTVAASHYRLALD